jgi:uncharacterized membrane protein
VHWLGVRWHQPPHGPAAILERLSRNLGDQDAAKLQSTYQANRATLDRLFADVQAGRFKVRALLAAEPFDQAAFAAALADTHAKRDVYDRAVEATIVSVVGQLSSEGRRELFANSRNPPPPPPDTPQH